MKLIFLYLLLINATGFVLMLADKHKARKKAWRIPERILFTVALAGGSLGCWIGMYTARHKTRHLTFVIGMPLILLVQLILLYWLWKPHL